MEGSRRDILKLGAAAALAPIAVNADGRAFAAPVAGDSSPAVPQDGRLRLLSYAGKDGTPRLIAELSLGLPLEPGDIIATGTPPGAGYARKPQEFLKPGDVMETEIVEIGTLRNTILAV